MSEDLEKKAHSRKTTKRERIVTILSGRQSREINEESPKIHDETPQGITIFTRKIHRRHILFVSPYIYMYDHCIKLLIVPAVVVHRTTPPSEEVLSNISQEQKADRHVVERRICDFHYKYLFRQSSPPSLRLLVDSAQSGSEVHCSRDPGFWALKDSPVDQCIPTLEYASISQRRYR